MHPFTMEDSGGLTQQSKAPEKRKCSKSTKPPSQHDVAFELSENQAVDTMFPPGCKVCFNHCTSSQNKHVYEATEGVVTSVAMGKNTIYVPIYTVEVVDEQGAISITQHWEDNLAYASGSPVFLDGTIEAEIVFSHKVTIDSSRGQTNLAYMVTSREAERVQTEKSVKPLRVKYRNLEAAKEVSRTENSGTADGTASAVKQTVKQQLQQDKGVKHKPDSQIPQEVIPNQMDSLSEILTEVPDTSQTNTGEYEVFIKEEHKTLICPKSNQDDNTDVNQIEQSLQFGNEQLSFEEKDVGTAATKPYASKKEQNCTGKRCTSTLLDDRWDPPKQLKPTAEDQVSKAKSTHVATPLDSASPIVSCSCKIDIPHWLYQTIEERNKLFLHILGTKPCGARGCNVSRIRKDTGCKIHIYEKGSTMYISITTDRSTKVSYDAVQKAESKFTEILVKFLKNPQRKDRLLEELASGTTRICHELEAAGNGQVQSLERALSGLSGTTHARDDVSLDGRPRKISRKDSQSEIDVPIWITRKEGWFEHIVGTGGRKQKKVAGLTHCNFSVRKNESKILFKTLNERGELHAAISTVVDSLIEFIDDENANPKFLCQLNSGVLNEPVKINQANVVRQLDPTCPNNILWAVVLDLPFHNQHCQHHGNFLKNKDILGRIKCEHCRLNIYGGNIGYDLSFPYCDPYVLVYGRKKAHVSCALDVLLQFMRSHQHDCVCEPSW